jgi:hypothetical protein
MLARHGAPTGRRAALGRLTEPGRGLGAIAATPTPLPRLLVPVLAREGTLRPCFRQLPASGILVAVAMAVPFR